MLQIAKHTILQCELEARSTTRKTINSQKLNNIEQEKLKQALTQELA